MVEDKKLAGRCLCGAVRFEAAPTKAEMDVCHCSMCRRWAGGVFMATGCGTSVHLIDDSELVFYRSSEWGERGFCRKCGSSLFWRSIQGGETVVSIQAFDDPAGFRFAEEIFIDEKPASYAFANDTRRKTGAEVMAAYIGKQEASHG